MGAYHYKTKIKILDTPIKYALNKVHTYELNKCLNQIPLSYANKIFVLFNTKRVDTRRYDRVV